MSNRNKVSRIAALEERLSHQDEELARLRAELAALRGVGFRSMRHTQRCPACNGGRLLHVVAPTELAHSGPERLAVHHTSGFWGTRSYGPIEHFICRSCQLIESHVIDLEGLEPDGKRILAIEPAEDPEAPGGPYR